MAKNSKELKALITLAGKLDPSVQKTMLEAVGQTNKARASIGLLEKAGKGTINLFKAGAKSLAFGFMGAITAGGVAAAALGKRGLSLASDLKEVQNVVDVTFGENGREEINAWSKSLLNGFGIGELSAKTFASTMGSMLKSSGVDDAAALKMSEGITSLAGDLASFRNLDTTVAFEKLRSGISGETEPLKQLGINMSVANLEAFALKEGITESFASMEQSEQVILRYNYLLNATKDAHGDFARTYGENANQQRLFKENLNNLTVKIMEGALPAMTKMAQEGNKMLASFDTKELQGFVSMMGELLVELMPIATQILPVIGNTLKNILPPILKVIKIVLPPLTTVLKLFAELLGKVLQGGAWLIEKLVGFGAAVIGDKKEGKANQDVYSRRDYYAHGGFANRPSIFGEAGPEAAIPIKKNNGRSIFLLQETAKKIGFDFKGGQSTNIKSQSQSQSIKIRSSSQSQSQSTKIFNAAAPLKAMVEIKKIPTEHFTAFGGKAGEIIHSNGGATYKINYAPVINGGNKEEISPVIRRESVNLTAMLKKAEKEKRRLSFD